MARVSSEVRELAREISAVKRGLRDATVTPQLGRSSLDDESINTYDGDGNLRARYGLQHDGTYTAAVLDGPVPPVPSAPVVSGGPGELSVTWDGTYVDDARAPMDFHVVEVWAADTDFSDRSEARLLGHFANESGGDITVARPVGEWHVALVAKAQSGRRSAVSGRAVAVVESVVDQGVIDDLNEKLDGLPSVTWSEDPPTAADGDGKPDNAVWRQVDASTDAVIGEWTWDETSSVWVARPIADDAIYSLDVGKLFASQLGVDTAVANEIWAEKIAASKIDAEEINTETLGADAGFIGVLNSAEIVGAVIKTAATGARVELDSGHGIRIFNTADELVLSADADGNLVTGVDQDNRVTIAPTGIDLSTLNAAQIEEWPTQSRSIGLSIAGDRIYVATGLDSSVEVYDLAGVKQSEWATGWAEGVAVSGDRVYIAEGISNRVTVYNLAGVKQSEWATGAGNAWSVAVTGDRVYVGGSDTVEVYDLAGVKQAEWATGGPAIGVAVTGDRVYVAEGGSDTVEVYDLAGVKQAEWATGGYAWSVAVAGDRVYVLADNTVEVYDLAGVKQAEWATNERAYNVAVAGDRVYVAAGINRSVHVYAIPGVPRVTASLDSETGLLTALSADLGGVTRTETLTPRNILPRGRTDNEDYAPTVEIVRPAFTQGLHVFEDETHRDLELPDPPDGTVAWTGTGETLTQWTRLNGAWVETGTDRITDGSLSLRVEDDGAPRLGSDPGLVYDRAYGQNVTAPGNARLALVTRFGTIGTLNERLPREYMPFNYASGTFSATVDAANTPKMHTITFPAGTFTSPPRVLMSYFLSIPDYAAISLFSVDTTNFSFYVTRKNTQPTTIVWRAFEDL